jgi:hypothetical protein
MKHCYTDKLPIQPIRSSHYPRMELPPHLLFDREFGGYLTHMDAEGYLPYIHEMATARP